MFRFNLNAILFSIASPLFFISCNKHHTENVPLTPAVSIIQTIADSAWNMCSSGDSASTYPILMELITLSDSAGLSFDKADGYRTVGLIYNQWTDLANALFYYRKAETVFNQLKTNDAEMGLAKTWLNMSTALIMGGDFETGMDYALKGETIFEKNKMYRYLINAYSKISQVYEYRNAYDMAGKYYLKMEACARLTNDPASEANCLQGLAGLADNEGNTTKAIQYLDSAIRIGEEQQLLNSLIVSYNNLAVIYSLKLKDERKALFYNEKALRVSQQYESPYDICESLERIAYRYYLLKKPDSSFWYYNQCEDYALKYNLPEIQQRIADGRAVTYAFIKDYKKAYEMQNLHMQLLDKITSEQTRKDMNFLSAKYESQLREAQITRLESEKKVAALELRRKNTILIFIIVGFGLTLTMAVFMLISYRQRQQLAVQKTQLIEQKLIELEKEKELVAIHSTLKGEETERGRIARDLHDGLGGMLSGVKLTLSTMKENHVLSADLAQAFNHALQMIDTSVSELRRVAHNMMPEILMAAGINKAIDSFCASLQNQEYTAIRYGFFGTDRRMEQGFELAVYRMAQEMVNNALKHAQAKHIDIQLLQDEQRICLTITDDGCGFDLHAINYKEGKGLANMRSRTHSFGGRFDMMTSPGEGTEIIIEFNQLENLYASNQTTA